MHWTRRDMFGFAGAVAALQALTSGGEANTRTELMDKRAGRPPARDSRLEVRTLDTPVAIPRFTSRSDWEKRAEWLRKQVLSAAGLWPMPQRTPLNAEIFDRTDGDGFSIEKVYFESMPGFYCTGNLYRPRPDREGKRPAVLNPHGHWNYGRLENNLGDVCAGVEVCSVPQRCMNFALQGYISFAYDMVGYNDSFQVPHHVTYDEKGRWSLTPDGERWGLWGASILGLQLWNSIRAVDFLQSLPDANPSRIIMTGASGGGTQTFLLTAVDDRVSMSAPVNMISHFMQGGDVCENAPNLRIDTSNVEIGAMMAPRPMFMVSATGDWTTDTPRVEYPAIRDIYALFGAAARLEQQQFPFQHNYNRTSRQAVYSFFARQLNTVTDHTAADALSERGEFGLDPGHTLVFAGRNRPANAKRAEEVFLHLISRARQQLKASLPNSVDELAHYHDEYEPVFRAALMVEWPDDGDLGWWGIGEGVSRSDVSGGQSERELLVSRSSVADRIPVRVRAIRGDFAVIIANAEGSAAAMKGAIARELRGRATVIAFDAFQTGLARDPSRQESGRFFPTYNRTESVQRVQDALTTIAWTKIALRPKRLAIVGEGVAGLWSLLLRPFVPAAVYLAAVADADSFASNEDEAYRERLHIPLLRRAGDFTSAACLGGVAPLFIHNAGRFDTTMFERRYGIVGRPKQIQVLQSAASARTIAAWILKNA